MDKYEKIIFALNDSDKMNNTQLKKLVLDMIDDTKDKKIKFMYNENLMTLYELFEQSQQDKCGQNLRL